MIHGQCPLKRIWPYKSSPWEGLHAPQITEDQAQGWVLGNVSHPVHAKFCPVSDRNQLILDHVSASRAPPGPHPGPWAMLLPLPATFLPWEPSPLPPCISTPPTTSLTMSSLPLGFLTSYTISLFIHSTLLTLITTPLPSNNNSVG